MPETSKILVTGGTGFIGSHLVHELESRGHEVWACGLLNSENTRYVRCDVSRYRQIERLVATERFDFVYHAAAEYGRWNGEDYYENLWLTNVVGTKHLLQVQQRHGFRMVFFGSAEVYGDYDGIMTEEVMETVPLKQMNDYAISKWVNELQIHNSAEMHGTETVRVRLFNVYGPGEHYTPYRGFIPKFVYMALHDRPYTVYSGHKRTLEYVEDISRTLSDIFDRFRPGEVYNLGGTTQYDIKQVSDVILSCLGKSDAKIVYEDAEPFTTRVKQPDSSKAETYLGFRLTVPLEEGIKRTVDWFQETYPG